MDDGDAACRIEVGMGIFSGRFAMSGPSRMGDGEVERFWILSPEAFKSVDFTDLFARVQSPFKDAGEACGVITAIFEVLEPVDANLC